MDICVESVAFVRMAFESCNVMGYIKEQRRKYIAESKDLEKDSESS